MPPVPGEKTIFQAQQRILLASTSPRRQAFLSGLGLAVTALAPPPGAEPSPLPGEAPEAYAVKAAEAKLFATLPLAADLPETSSHPKPGFVLVAADTIVVGKTGILGKPASPKDALRMLCSLAGTTHTVISACSVLALRGTAETANSPGTKRSGALSANYSARPDAPGLIPTSFAVSSKVSMWQAPEAVLRAYVDGGEPMDKAGAYAIQGNGAFLVSEVQGSWSNVVGLPMAELVQVLLQMKAIAPVAKER
ncbi:Maf family protein [Desulfovibrio sp. OttesenSCG-928-G15]|nr:Maf family protein [Desulfovibrio sp. OttesenSCG-928-G15]